MRYPLGDGFLDPFREAIEIGRRGGSPVHITHFYHRPTFPGPPEQMLALVDDARAEGLDVTFDLYPYEWASTRLLIMLPTWVQAGGLGPLKERLADRGTRDADPRRDDGPRPRCSPATARWDATCASAPSRAPSTSRWEGRTLGDVMRDTGRDAVDAICDLLLAEDLRVEPGHARAPLDGDPGLPAHPLAMVGTDDVSSGTSRRRGPTARIPRILGQFVREERLLGLEEAVRRMTGVPAARLGLRDRGLLADGLAADLVVFDPATIRTTGDLRRAAAVPDRDPVRDRQRHGRDRRRRAHRRDAGPRAPARSMSPPRHAGGRLPARLTLTCTRPHAAAYDKEAPTP